MQHYTTIEQSKKLVELGLNPDTADMFWQSNLNSSDRQYLLNIGEEECFDIELNFEHCSIGDYDIPCWSLGALMEVMPKEDVKPFEDSNPFIGYGDGLYRCVYLNGDWESSCQTIGDSLIEAAYNMVVWLLENGYIKKGE